MTFAKRARRITLGLAAVASLSGAAFAQDISESHLKACRAAVDAINATDSYDGILPAAAQALKTQLIQKNPDLQEVIINTVDEQTMKMVSRRGDLERDRPHGAQVLRDVLAGIAVAAGGALDQGSGDV